MEHELDVGERFEARTEARLRLPHALRHSAHPAVRLGVEVKDAVGLSEPHRPEHDGFRAVRRSGHVPCSLGTASGRNTRVAFFVVSRDDTRSDLYDALVRLLRARQDAPRWLAYEELSLDDDPAFRQTVFDATGGWTVPQILVDDVAIGGYTELSRLDREGRLNELLAA